MSGPSAPGPAPQRSASTGPNGPLTTPTTAAVVNGIGSVNPGPSTITQPATTASATTGASAAQGMTQQNLNQIVIDYLAKKGYLRTEATLRAESSNQHVPTDAEVRRRAVGPPKYLENFGKMTVWVEDALDVYKPEILRLLWPFFVYSYLDLVDQLYSKDATIFFKKYQEQFRKEHEYDLRRFERITLAEHTSQDNIAKIYKEQKYRVMLSQPAYTYLVTFLEALPADGYQLFLKIVEEHMDVRQVDRATDDRFSFAGVIERAKHGRDIPLEDEGIPGHRPGNAVSSTDPNIGNNLANLKLGKMPLEKDLEGDLLGDLMDLDLEVQPLPGHPTLVDVHNKVNIKREDDDDGPTRTEIPFPPSTVREVAMEVQKIRENRDRFKVEGRTGGVGAGLSCVMYTFHNTYDVINCIDISGDLRLIAAGTADAYIRVWTLDGSELGVAHGGQKQNSQRLIGHCGPVYSVHFQPSTVQPPQQTIDTGPKWLLSGGMDGSIRLWNLDLWQCCVVYKGHIGPVWDVQWGPFGHYFISGGSDKLGRIWTTDKMRPCRLLAGHDDDVDVTAWHPNASYVFTASSDKTVRMWAVTNGNAVRMFTGHTSAITALECSRNGKSLASADDSGNILLWDLASGRLLKRMKGHGKGGIWSMSWSVESNVLVSGGADNTLRVWDVTGPAKDPTAGKPGDTGKTDGITGGAGGTAGAAAAATAGGINLGVGSSTGPKKKGKDAVITADQISAFSTKASPIYFVHMTNMNLVLASGAFLPENQLK